MGVWRSELVFIRSQLIQFNVQPTHVRFDVLFENVKQSRRLDMLRGWRERVASIDSPRLKQKTFRKMPLANANALRKRLRPITRALVNQMEQKTARVTPGRGITSGDTEAGIMQMSEEFEFAGYKVFTRERLEAHRRACAVWTKACSTQAAQKNTAFPPEWIDLMMWAVSNSRTVLARPLFEKTEEPLRAALIACRYCQRRAQLAGHPQEKEEWSEQVGRWPVNRVIVYLERIAHHAHHSPHPPYSHIHHSTHRYHERSVLVGGTAGGREAARIGREVRAGRDAASVVVWFHASSDLCD